MPDSQLPPTASRSQNSLIDYPCLFPIKVMGTRVDGFTAALVSVARDFDPDFDEARLELRESSGGNYLSVTLTVTATSREQLDNLYRALTGHPLVKIVL
ncbi:MAG: DUF493 family protein [Burkholderiales bacterium]|jgi:putative lipoic acid-binding regulatory protein|nr:DUF493 family protein [Burkholderiales bacterium]